MHKIIRTVFSEIINSLPAPKRVLEVGATKKDTLLNLPSLSGAECIGVNQDPSEETSGGPNPEDVLIRTHSGHNLHWRDDYFDLVLCNSVLEHDPAFWKTLYEMRRVLKGYMIIGVPAFVEESNIILGVHRYPKDYYRFGEDAVREVFFDGFDLCGLKKLMLNIPPPAPRIVAWGSTK